MKRREVFLVGMDVKNILSSQMVLEGFVGLVCSDER